MDTLKLTEEEKRLFIDYMLENEELEKIIERKDKQLPDYQLSVYGSIIWRCRNDAGFIVALDSSEIPVGKIGFYTELTQECQMKIAARKDGRKYVMAFTSKEKFKKYFDVSGVVLPMDDLIAIICLKKEEVDGIVINLGKKELILEISALEDLLQCIGHFEFLNKQV